MRDDEIVSRDYQRQQIIEEAVSAAERIILDRSDGSSEELAYLTYKVAETYMGKIGLVVLMGLHRRDFEDDFPDKHPTLERCDVRQATHVELQNRMIQRIESKWGIDEEGRLAKPSQGGFGCITESGNRIGMMEAMGYYREK